VLAPEPMPVAPVAPPPAVAAPASPIELMSLKLMREKGILTKDEYESAIKDLSETSGQVTPTVEGQVVLGKWSTTLYGFVESDYIWDSTRAFNDLAGASQVPRAGTNAGDNGRFTVGIRNSRLGIRMRAPETHGIRTTAQFEFDFLGTQLPISNVSPTPGAPNASGTESTFFTSPVLRVRHLNLKMETPVVDILAGQYWSLFGWGSSYQVNTVEIQGVPGEIYYRTPQLRLSKTLKAYPISVDLAVAAVRPVQRDSAFPDGQAGIKFNVDGWKGAQTTGSTGTQISSLSIAVSGLLQHVAVDQFAATPKFTNDLTTSAIAADAFVPIIPATTENKDNALSLQGEFSTGYGDAPYFTGLTGGIAFPTLAPTTPGGTAPNFSADIDNGIVTYDGAGKLHGIQWTTWLIGGQYYLPIDSGKVFVSGNYSHISSANTHYYGTPSKLTAAEDWFDANLFFDPVPAVRVGAEYANFNTMYVDGIHAINHRVQVSGFFIF
jgi:hypothetical protein